MRNSVEKTILTSPIFDSANVAYREQLWLLLAQEIRKHSDKWMDDYQIETVEAPRLE